MGSEEVDMGSDGEERTRTGYLQSIWAGLRLRAALRIPGSSLGHG